MDLSWTETAGRLAIGGFFLAAGIVNLVTPGSIRDHIDRMRAFGMPLPAAAFWCGIVLQLVGAALVLANYHADIGAWCLIAFTAIATAVFHRFWQKEETMQKRVSRLFFMSNLAIIGGLLLLAGTPARAQGFADRPVKIDVSHAKRGTQVVFDNRIGSRGVLAA